jgi:hypothetical protein
MELARRCGSCSSLKAERRGLYFVVAQHLEGDGPSAERVHVDREP